ncbi:MAG: hypothetical protein E6J91_24465 [Deltaproteobacteria bacterium]|nr:MAG: hypothetical protein E6J91_24465 [Deltaproteobacteria bacterium]
MFDRVTHARRAPPSPPRFRGLQCSGFPGAASARESPQQAQLAIEQRARLLAVDLLPPAACRLRLPMPPADADADADADAERSGRWSSLRVAAPFV